MDRVLKGLIPGDNIVWQVDAIEDYGWFVEPYCQAGRRLGRKLIYFRFARHAPLVSVEHGAEGMTSLRFSYSVAREGEEKESMDYKVQLVATPCRFGGRRYWFICPLSKDGRACGRRVARLYIPPGGRYFGCRHCYELTYRSAQEHDGRLSALAKLPPDVLLQMSRSGSPRNRLLCLEAILEKCNALR